MGRIRVLLPVLAAMAAAVALVWLALASRPGPEAPPVEPTPPVGDVGEGGDFEAYVQVQENLEVAGPVRLDFRGFNGSLSIKPGAPGKLEIRAIKTAYGTDDATARQRAHDLPLSIRTHQNACAWHHASDALCTVKWHGCLQHH